MSAASRIPKWQTHNQTGPGQESADRCRCILQTVKLISGLLSASASASQYSSLLCLPAAAGCWNQEQLFFYPAPFNSFLFCRRIHRQCFGLDYLIISASPGIHFYQNTVSPVRTGVDRQTSPCRAWSEPNFPLAAFSGSSGPK